MRMRTPRSPAARSAPATSSPTGTRDAHVVEREVEAPARLGDPGQELAGDLLRALAALRERAQAEAGAGAGASTVTRASR